MSGNTPTRLHPFKFESHVVGREIGDPYPFKEQKLGNRIGIVHNVTVGMKAQNAKLQGTLE